VKERSVEAIEGSVNDQFEERLSSYVDAIILVTQKSRFKDIIFS